MKKIFSVIVCLAIFFSINVPVSALSGSAKSAVVINGATGTVLWEKNATEKLPMASTTKIMTALLLCENGNLDKEIKTTREMVTVEGSSMGLLEGDTVSYRDLLYGMMLASGNDAANTTAISLCGSVEKFVSLMNEKAGEIGLKNTSFETPSGLDSENHYSTAIDMALLARYALKNADFKAACSSKYATLSYGNPPYKRTLKNHNKLLFSYDGSIGVKTGFTKKSGRCLVSAAVRDGKYIIAVTLCDPNDWADHKAMLDFGFSKLNELELNIDTPNIKVVGSKRQSVATTCEKVSIFLNETEQNKITKKIFLPNFIYAGINAGDTVGKVEYMLDGKVIAKKEITVLDSAPTVNEAKPITKILSILKMLFKAMI